MLLLVGACAVQTPGLEVEVVLEPTLDVPDMMNDVGAQWRIEEASLGLGVLELLPCADEDIADGPTVRVPVSTAVGLVASDVHVFPTLRPVPGRYCAVGLQPREIDACEGRMCAWQARLGAPTEVQQLGGLGEGRAEIALDPPLEIGPDARYAELVLAPQVEAWVEGMHADLPTLDVVEALCERLPSRFDLTYR